MSLQGPNKSIARLKDLNFNDDASSVRVGPGLRVRICKNSDCWGPSWDDAVDLVGPYNAQRMVHRNDWASAIYTYAYDETNLDDARVSLFSEPNYDMGGAAALKIGTYDST